MRSLHILSSITGFVPKIMAPERPRPLPRTSGQIFWKSMQPLLLIPKIKQKVKAARKVVHVLKARITESVEKETVLT